MSATIPCSRTCTALPDLKATADPGPPTSKTWRRSTPVTGRSASLARHRPQQPGSCRISWSGRADCTSIAPLCPSCPPGLRPLRFRSDRGLGAGLASPSPDGGLEEFRRFCFSRGLKLSDPLPGLRQVHPRLLQRSHRLGQLPVQRCRQRGQHLIRRLFITGHTGTLRVGHAHRMHPPRSGVSPATGSDARLDEPGSEPGYRQASSPM